MGELRIEKRSRGGYSANTDQVRRLVAHLLPSAQTVATVSFGEPSGKTNGRNPGRNFFLPFAAVVLREDSRARTFRTTCSARLISGPYTRFRYNRAITRVNGAAVTGRQTDTNYRAVVFRGPLYGTDSE